MEKLPVCANAFKDHIITSRFESDARKRGYSRIAGADEVGRGCLFGSVFAAAVILDPAKPVRGLNDSKVLSPQKRAVLAERIQDRAVSWAVGAVDAFWIDRINIYQASRLAMKQAVEKLNIPPDFLFVDALTLDVNIPQKALIKGDLRCASIAAASILAKVARDQSMAKWHEIYPEYNLASNKGYCAPDHYNGLDAVGPVAQHRYSFEPVRAAAQLGQGRLF